MLPHPTVRRASADVGCAGAGCLGCRLPGEPVLTPADTGLRRPTGVPIVWAATFGGHRRYSRYQLRLAARARELCDQGTALDAACRIIILEDQLEEALCRNGQHRQH
ncbi:hypothetical protein [Dactylosporangium roseum]|uniref:hypothetical protein n=1 Tax=Dactylosporangium roseum TaxID=47989 RepID=UPI0021B20F39|nr:hypothetical protein [Dactylosporangium roseum]